MNNTNNNIFNMMKTFKNPRSAVLNIAKNSNNPILNNLIELAEQGKNDEIENFARNYAKEHNIDFDKQFNSLQSMANMFHR